MRAKLEIFLINFLFYYIKCEIFQGYFKYHKGHDLLSENNQQKLEPLEKKDKMFCALQCLKQNDCYLAKIKNKQCSIYSNCQTLDSIERKHDEHLLERNQRDFSYITGKILKTLISLNDH